jgi:tRNA nucleotidyltransferase/poly(A) polymerase
VAFTTAEHDAQRRDFTINGLFFDPQTDQVVDYVGGIADLKAGVVRAIGDPRKRFAEDKLRLLRAVRFAASFDFALEPATLLAIHEMADAVLQVSGERIGGELRRILTHGNRSRGVELLVQTELLRPLLPELWPYASANDPAWRSAVDCMARLENPAFPLAFAALLYGIAEDSQVLAIGRRLRLSNKELDRVRWLLVHLPTVLSAATAPWPRLQRVLANEGAGELLTLAAAILPDADAALARCREQVARPIELWNPQPLVTGDDLIAQGIKPGRHFAALLEHLRDEQLEGRLTTREESLTEAGRWLESRVADLRP